MGGVLEYSMEERGSGWAESIKFIPVLRVVEWPDLDNRLTGSTILFLCLRRRFAADEISGTLKALKGNENASPR